MPDEPQKSTLLCPHGYLKSEGGCPLCGKSTSPADLPSNLACGCGYQDPSCPCEGCNWKCVLQRYEADQRKAARKSVSPPRVLTPAEIHAKRVSVASGGPREQADLLFVLDALADMRAENDRLIEALANEVYNWLGMKAHHERMAASRADAVARLLEDVAYGD